MKKIILLATVFVSLSSYASSFNCQWLNKGIVDGDNFYRPASFQIDVNKKTATVSQDSFFYRTYTPCWAGNYESCAFNYELPTDGFLTVEKQTKKDIEFSFESVTGYGVGNLTLSFEKNISRINVGEKAEVVMTGDDGEGTFLNETYFSCQRLQ